MYISENLDQCLPNTKAKFSHAIGHGDDHKNYEKASEGVFKFRKRSKKQAIITQLFRIDVVSRVRYSYYDVTTIVQREVLLFQT